MFLKKFLFIFVVVKYMQHKIYHFNPLWVCIKWY